MATYVLKNKFLSLCFERWTAVFLRFLQYLKNFSPKLKFSKFDEYKGVQKGRKNPAQWYVCSGMAKWRKGSIEIMSCCINSDRSEGDLFLGCKKSGERLMSLNNLFGNLKRECTHMHSNKTSKVRKDASDEDGGLLFSQIYAYHLLMVWKLAQISRFPDFQISLIKF